MALPYKQREPRERAGADLVRRAGRVSVTQVAVPLALSITNRIARSSRGRAPGRSMVATVVFAVAYESPNRLGLINLN
jgi:hypothetical protein